MQRFNFIGSTTINFGRRLGAKDKKKRKVINNSPSAEGQIPMSEIGQQRTGYKYYRKRRALGFLSGTAVLGGIAGAALGGTAGIVLRKPNQGAILGAVLGAGALGGAGLLEHASNKVSPYYQKNFYKNKK